MNTRGREGQVLLWVLISAGVLTLFVSTLYFMVVNEGRWSLKQKKSSVAYQLAESAVARGYWKLQEADQNWIDIVETSPPNFLAGYQNDVTYADIPSTTNAVGKYRINISTTTNIQEVEITGIGATFPPGTNTPSDVRGLKVRYRKTAVRGAITARGGIQYKPQLIVHWGPVVTYGDMTIQDSRGYPWRDAKGKIDPWDTDPTPPNGGDAPAFYYHAFDTTLGNPPEVDLARYKTDAHNTRIPIPKKGSGEHTFGTATCCGYFPYESPPGKVQDVEFSKSGGVEYIVDNPTNVIYLDGLGGEEETAPKSAKLKDGSYFNMKALISMRNLHFHGQGKVFVATIPPTASDMYYNGPVPPPSGPNPWVTDWISTFAAPANPNYPQYKGLTPPETGCVVHGFIYIGTDEHCSGGQNSVVGAMQVLGDVQLNTFYIYYDSAAAGGVYLRGGAPTRYSWNEFLATW